jgi:nucleoside-triphosphatase
MEKIFLTGEPHVGKSTIISKLYEKYSNNIVGVIAGEVQDGQGARQGFTSGTFSDPTLLTIAHSSSDSEIRVSRYGVDTEALDKVAELLSQQLEVAKESGSVLIFDEIGLIQSFSKKLKAQIDAALASDVPSIFAIKRDDSVSEWLGEVKKTPNTRTVTITEETRDQVLEELSHYIDAHTTK